MPRTPLIAGNWKMNTTVSEAIALVQAMLPDLERLTAVERVLCPPFVSLAHIKALIDASSVKLGAQNMHFPEKGAYTGEVSPLMLAGLCEYVILGHSERRAYFGESDEIVNKKVRAALGAGLKPILCIGERWEERQAGRTDKVITAQLRGALEEVRDVNGLVIAYEPVWAIGTGRAATEEQANATIAVIRQEIERLYGSSVAQDTRIQYGGSVTPENIAQFVAQPEIDGALVGGASLKAADFVAIVRETARVKGRP